MSENGIKWSNHNRQCLLWGNANQEIELVDNRGPTIIEIIIYELVVEHYHVIIALHYQYDNNKMLLCTAVEQLVVSISLELTQGCSCWCQQKTPWRTWYQQNNSQICVPLICKFNLCKIMTMFMFCIYKRWKVNSWSLRIISNTRNHFNNNLENSRAF